MTRVLTGDRPTGPLHVGHYFGSLRNRVLLQDGGAEIFVLIADYQVLTDRDTAERLEEYVIALVADYLAIGIDPGRSVIFAHSAVPALNQLLLPFLSLVTVPDLRRNPTVKDEIAHSRQASVSGLMFTYPVHQAADILFCKADTAVGHGGRDRADHPVRRHRFRPAHRLRPGEQARRLGPAATRCSVPGQGPRRGGRGPDRHSRRARGQVTLSTSVYTHPHERSARSARGSTRSDSDSAGSARS
jgi:hypothetical protein